MSHEMRLKIYFMKYSEKQVSQYILALIISTRVTLKEKRKQTRSIHQRCSVSNFKEKHLCQSLFFNKAAALRPVTLLKRRPWHSCIPVNFAKFLRAPLKERLW